MGYKRTTKKTGPNTRKSVTYNHRGPTTISNSSTSGGVTYTHSSRGGKYYTTRTQRFADGYVERKRIMSSSPKKAASPRKRTRTVKSGSSGGGAIWLALIVIFGLFVLIGG